MATFPALPVTGRTLTQGVYPHTPHGVYNGRQVRVRHSNTIVGNLLRLRFDMLSRSEMLSLQSHYAGQLGGFLAFAIPDDVLDGINTPATVTPTDHRWVYVAPPRVTDVAIDGASPSNRYVVEVELASVPPENTIVGGERWTVRISWAPGRSTRPCSCSPRIRRLALPVRRRRPWPVSFTRPASRTTRRERSTSIQIHSG